MTKSNLNLALLVATGLTAGCFNTKNVQNGGLKCAPDGVCPDGFSCRSSDNLCYRNGTDGGNACTPPADLPPGNLCDPVCQSGCPSNQRCQQVLDPLGNYSFGCETPPTGTPLDVFKPCDTGNDLCKPGLLCVEPPLGSTGCVAQCYRYCRQDSDCPANTLCALSSVIGGQQSMPICAPPAVACSPALQTAAPACSPSLTGSTCYVFSKELPDETMCDCAGTIAAGLACTDLHSCVAGYECAGGKCQKVCLLQTGVLACPVGQTCSSLNASTKYGTCQ
jgi:hypothetical protein